MSTFARWVHYQFMLLFGGIMRIKGVIVLLLVLLCSGCVNDGYYYSRNPDFRFYQDEAVMLLGVVGSYDLNVVKGKNADGKRYSLVVHPRNHSSEIVDVYALAFPAGESLAIEYIQFETLPGSNAVQARFPYLDVKDPRLMRFDNEGVFYYGTVVTSDKGVGLTDEYRDQMIALAKRKYPSLFSGAEPREIIFP